VHASLVERARQLEGYKRSFPALQRAQIEMQLRQDRAVRMWRDYYRGTR
jgi:hypothetical protein